MAVVNPNAVQPVGAPANLPPWMLNAASGLTSSASTSSTPGTASTSTSSTVTDPTGANSLVNSVGNIRANLVGNEGTANNLLSSTPDPTSTGINTGTNTLSLGSGIGGVINSAFPGSGVPGGTNGGLTGNPVLDNAILQALGALSGAFTNTPTTVTNNGTTLNNATTNTNSNTNTNNTTTNNGTVTTTPNLNPTAQNLITEGGNLAASLSSDPNLTGYLANQESQISQSTIDQENALQSELAAHGITSGAASVAPILNAENQKFAQDVQLQNQIPLLAQQLNQQDLSAIQSFLNAIPEGVTQNTNNTSNTTGTSSTQGTSNTQGVQQNNNTQVTSGNMIGGALTGLLSIIELINGLNGGNSKGSTVTNNFAPSVSDTSSATGTGGTTSAGSTASTSSKPGTVNVGLPGINIGIGTQQTQSPSQPSACPVGFSNIGGTCIPNFSGGGGDPTGMGCIGFVDEQGNCIQ